MNAQLTSLVRVKKPYMKASTKEGRDDEKKAWRLMQSGLLSLPTFASGVSVEALKKKFWVLYTAFTIENNKLETATGNLPEEYGPFEQDMVHIKKEYEPKRQSQEDAKEAEKAKLEKNLKDGGMVRNAAMSRGSGNGEAADGERQEKRARHSGSSTTHFQEMLVGALKPTEKSAEDKKTEQEERDREHDLRGRELNIRSEEALARSEEVKAQREEATAERVHNAQEAMARREQEAQREARREAQREQEDMARREESKAQRDEENKARREESKAQREQTMELMQMMAKQMADQKK